MGIVLNKNAVPNYLCVGECRLRHPGRHSSVTTQGMGVEQMPTIAELIGTVIKDEDGAGAGGVPAYPG